MHPPMGSTPSRSCTAAWSIGSTSSPHPRSQQWLPLMNLSRTCSSTTDWSKLMKQGSHTTMPSNYWRLQSLTVPHSMRSWHGMEAAAQITQLHGHSSLNMLINSGQLHPRWTLLTTSARRANPRSAHMMDSIDLNLSKDLEAQLEINEARRSGPSQDGQ